MKRLLGFCFLLLPILCLPGQTAAQIKGKTLDALARKLVVDCAGIKEGESVLIVGGLRDMELLEDLSVHVRKIGAFPLLSIGSDRMTRRMFTDVPAKYDTQSPDFDLKLLNAINATLSVEFGETEGLLSDIPPERFAARGKAAQPLGQIIRERKIRGVNLGNALYPTSTLAKTFGMSKNELSKIFWAGVNVDYKKLQKTGESVRKVLESGKEAEITTATGTNLRVRIEQKPVFVSDGVISEDDMNRGPGGYNVWLPAGEVYLAVVPGTAEGKIVLERHFFEGKEVKGLALTFSGGKLTSMTAKSGLKRLKAVYDAAGEGKDSLSYLDVGINPNVGIPKKSKMVAWMASGMVTVGIGNNTFTGGDNNSTFGLPMFLTGATLSVDGKIIVAKGKLKM